MKIVGVGLLGIAMYLYTVLCAGIYVLIQSTVNYLCRLAERKSRRHDSHRNSHIAGNTNLLSNKNHKKIYVYSTKMSLYFLFTILFGVSPSFFFT